MESEFSWNFEHEAWSEPRDESSINLRAWFDRMPKCKMQEFVPNGATQVMEWDCNFRSDRALFLVCCERGAEIGGYRRLLHECLEYRRRVAAATREPAGGEAAKNDGLTYN